MLLFYTNSRNYFEEMYFKPKSLLCRLFYPYSKIKWSTTFFLLGWWSMAWNELRTNGLARHHHTYAQFSPHHHPHPMTSADALLSPRLRPKWGSWVTLGQTWVTPRSLISPWHNKKCSRRMDRRSAPTSSGWLNRNSKSNLGCVWFACTSSSCIQESVLPIVECRSTTDLLTVTCPGT